MEIQELFDFYNQRRKTTLTKDQFTSMLMMLPATIVANADNDFDAIEKQNLAEACFALEEEKWVTCDIYSELCYLATSSDNELLNKIFESIKAESNQNSEIKKIITELMIGMAEASNGISEVEDKKIKELNQIFEF